MSVRGVKTDYTIQETAVLTGVSVHTLRYYERIGLLRPINRAVSGHRRYALEDHSLVIFLTRLRSTGMPIREMRKYTTLLFAGPGTEGERLVILETHRAKVLANFATLQENLAILEKKITNYKEL